MITMRSFLAIVVCVSVSASVCVSVCVRAYECECVFLCGLRAQNSQRQDKFTFFTKHFLMKRQFVSSHSKQNMDMTGYYGCRGYLADTDYLICFVLPAVYVINF